MLVISMVPYMFIRLIGCLVGPKISRDAHKLARTSRVIKKKSSFVNLSTEIVIRY